MEDKGECRSNRRIYIWLGLVAGSLTVVAAISFFDNEAIVPPTLPSQKVSEDQNALRILDKSPIGREVLISKTSFGDLWLRDAIGRESCLASNVLRASFSPDGKKFAYDTSENEILIQTIEGQQLARLMRASDHHWLANSAAVTFSATASAEYPEIEQIVIYHLATNSTLPRAFGQ